MNGRRFLVVATRGSADKGRIPDDEYCAQWGFDASQNFKWCSTDKVAFLVLHGYRGADLERAVREAAGHAGAPRPKDLASYGLFYHHSVFDSPAKAVAVQDLIESTFQTTLTTRIYRSEGGLAIEKLIRDIQSTESSEPADFIQAIEQAAAGRSIFVAKLREVHSALIRLRLLFAAGEVRKGQDGKASGASDVLSKPIGDAAGVIRAAVEGSKGKFRLWLQEIDKSNFGEERHAVALLAYLGGASKPDAIRAQDLWQCLSNLDSILPNAMKDVEGVTYDIGLFAKAVDILLVAAERLPNTLPCPRDPKELPTKDTAL